MIMKKLLILAASGVLLYSCTTAPAPSADGRASGIVAALHDPSTNRVLVASHRGDWRNWPENSLPAIESVIHMGVDIMEIDLKLTADSVLVLCHDKSIDRTTSGKGLVCEISFDSIRRCVLRTGHNVKTAHRMPTLREALETCRDRIVVNIDQGYEYYDLVLALTEELGMTDQVLIKGKYPVAAVAQKFAEHPRNMMYMPIIDILKPQGRPGLRGLLGPALARSRGMHARGRPAGGKALGQLTLAIPLRRARRRHGLHDILRGGVRTSGRNGRDDDPDRPARTAVELPPRARSSRLTT